MFTRSKNSHINAKKQIKNIRINQTIKNAFIQLKMKINFHAIINHKNLIFKKRNSLGKKIILIMKLSQ